MVMLVHTINLQCFYQLVNHLITMYLIFSSGFVYILTLFSAKGIDTDCLCFISAITAPVPALKTLCLWS